MLGRLGGLGKVGGMGERGLQVGWVCKQQPDGAGWGSVQPRAILIRRKHQPPHPTSISSFIIVHLIFFFLLVL